MCIWSRERPFKFWDTLLNLGTSKARQFNIQHNNTTQRTNYRTPSFYSFGFGTTFVSGMGECECEMPTQIDLEGNKASTANTVGELTNTKLNDRNDSRSKSDN